MTSVFDTLRATELPCLAARQARRRVLEDRHTPRGIDPCQRDPHAELRQLTSCSLSPCGCGLGRDVNELYLRLTGRKTGADEGRLHFFAAASRIMRHVLVDHARARRARHGDSHVTLVEWTLPSVEPRVDLIALEEALQRFEKTHPREAQVVELRSFGGLTIEEAATYLGAASGTVKRDWRFARSFLQIEMEGYEGGRGT